MEKVKLFVIFILYKTLNIKNKSVGINIEYIKLNIIVVDISQLCLSN